MPVRVVCVSEPTGSGGPAIARLVASRLGFRHVNDELVHAAAAREGLDHADVADVERRRSLVRRLLGPLGQAHAAEHSYTALYRLPPPPERARRELIRAR